MEGSEITCNTAALANEAVHDMDARIRLVEHLNGPRRIKLLSYCSMFLASYPTVNTDAEEILNSVLGTLWEKYCRGNFKAGENNLSFYALLKRITERKVQAQFKRNNTQKRKVSREQPREGDDCVVQGDDHVQLVAIQDLVEQLFEDIESCPNVAESKRAQLKDILLFTLEDKYSQKKISNLMNISLSKVRRLQDLLRSILEHRREDASD